MWGKVKVTDLCRLPDQALSDGGTYKIQIRDVGSYQASFDQLSMGVVDHDPSTVAIAGPNMVYVGTLDSVGSVTDVTGKETTGLPVDSTSTFDAQSAQYLLVDLGDSSSRPALVIESSGGVSGAQPDSTGIIVQKPVQYGGWETIATVHPRREFDQSVVDALGNRTLRVVFMRDYKIRSLQRLTIASTVVPRPLTLVSASQTNVGGVKDAINASGGEEITVNPGDTVSVEYGGVPPEEGKVRDLFLIATGAYSNPATTGSSIGPGMPVIAATPTYQFALGAAHPNPSSGTVAFSFTMAQQGPAQIRVYDVAGRLVKTLASGTAEAGPHDLVWNATDDGGRRVGAGVYFYRMDAGSWRSQRKVVFLER
ncbi:MAG TPA: FlgD immunoglobulin-like domain containing protein [Candidatus Eisenbacteria bacterium]|nr:FlgD immunoglobulin-like domain containing protein [Candidatus Eisenbacteria bacterium]